MMDFIDVTGANSEPGVGSDWVKTGAVETGDSSGLIRISEYSGYLIDKVGKPNESMAEAWDVFYGAGIL